MHKGPSYRVAKNLFSEIKNQNQKPINAKIGFFILVGHVGTRAIFSKSTAADKNTAGRVRGKSHHVLPWSARSGVRLHKPGGEMLAPRATRAQPDTQRLVLALRRARHTRQLCSCCGRCQLLPDNRLVPVSPAHSWPRCWFLVPRGAILSLIHI